MIILVTAKTGTHLQRLDEQVLQTFNLSKQRDGARRVHAELASHGERYDVKTIGTSMQRQSLVPKAAGKFKVTPTAITACRCRPIY